MTDFGPLNFEYGKPDRIHEEKDEDENGRKFHSWYKGTIRVKKVTSEYIELENICKIRKVDVFEFRVEHRLNNELIGSIVINRSLILNPKQTLRIYSNRTMEDAEFKINIDSFDDSTSSRTSIFNNIEPNEERGWFVYLS